MNRLHFMFAFVSCSVKAPTTGSLLNQCDARAHLVFLIRWSIPQCLAFLAAGWCDRVAAACGAPERVHTAERPFGFHGSAGQQQSTEGEVFGCDHQHYRFNVWKDALGTSEDLRTESKLCFIDSVSNYLIGCFGNYFGQHHLRGGYLWVREKGGFLD